MTDIPCPHCGKPINPASLLGKGRKKTMSPAAMEARRKNAKKGGRKKHIKIDLKKPPLT